MHPNVTWPNGWEGGWVTGRGGVREYWRRQWAVLDPRVEPLEINWDDDGRAVVTVHQTVRDLTGNVLSHGTVEHVYELQGGLITRMEIRT